VTAQTATSVLTTACYGVGGAVAHLTLSDVLGKVETLGWLALAALITSIAQLATKEIWGRIAAARWRRRNPLPTHPDVPLPRPRRRMRSNHEIVP
jgi:hypothetical protein